jgi:hypothetical protein
MIMKRAMTAVVLLLVALAAAGPAAAAPRRPGIDLVISYMAEAGYAAAVTLTCNPVGGAHPRAAKACAALKKTGGKPAKLKPAKTICTLEYAPITAEIEGTWKGRGMRWSKTFPNPCALRRATGVVFAF